MITCLKNVSLETASLITTKFKNKTSYLFIMGLFGFGSNKKDVVDLAERYRQQKERDAATQEIGKQEAEAMGASEGDSVEERRRKLAKRLVDIVTRLEDISNKIYHLQQRVEVLERKSDLGSPKTEGP